MNSTEILRCPRPQSCKGGHEPDNQHPVQCETGYTGVLCMDCDITRNGDKYQRISTYQCSICPDIVVNSFLVILVIFLAFAYLLILVVTTIRKKKENQTSILLRIMTNYLQLIAATYSFNIKFPDSMINAFSSVEIFGPSSNAYLSFD